MKESSAEVAPKLYETQTMIRQFGRDIHKRMAAITELLSPSGESDSDEDVVEERRMGIATLGNLNSHLRTAADMVSSASTAIGVANTIDDRGSEFDDVFPQPPNDQTLNWIESNRIPEIESSADQLASDLASARDASEWDSDDEMELELARESVDIGILHLEKKNYKEAEAHFKYSIDKVNTRGSTAALMIDQRTDAIQGLASSYFWQMKFDEAEKLIRDMMETNRNGYGDPDYNTLRLAEVLMRKGDLAEALLYARKACKAYKKAGDDGRIGYRNSLKLLVEICKASGKKTDEDVYSALLDKVPTHWVAKPLPGTSLTVRVGRKISTAREEYRIPKKESIEPGTIVNSLQKSDPEVIYEEWQPEPTSLQEGSIVWEDTSSQMKAQRKNRDEKAQLKDRDDKAQGKVRGERRIAEEPPLISGTALVQRTSKNWNEIQQAEQEERMADRDNMAPRQRGPQSRTGIPRSFQFRERPPSVYQRLKWRIGLD
jgi:tetratricopeptide (TPR) repeat protein